MFRAAAGAAAGILSVIAFVTLPFAEAYSLGFLMPLFAAVISAMFLKEQIRPRIVLAIVLGLVGVLIVLRPGFRDVTLGHLAGIGVALCSATGVVALRAIGSSENRSTVVTVTMLVALLVNGVLTPFDFRELEQFDLAYLFAAGMLGGIAQILLVAATRVAPANRVAPTQYSQIIWAILLGAVLFGEAPDLLAIGGMLLVSASDFLRYRAWTISLTLASFMPGRLRTHGMNGHEPFERQD